MDGLEGAFGVCEAEGPQAVGGGFAVTAVRVPAAARAVNDSSNGRKNSRSWIQRTFA